MTIKPGDDFFRHVNGTWMANNTIPADRVTWGTNVWHKIRVERKLVGEVLSLLESGK